jgi:hypothetical protein
VQVVALAFLMSRTEKRGIGHNPRTKEQIEIPASQSPQFKAEKPERRRIERAFPGSHIEIKTDGSHRFVPSIQLKAVSIRKSILRHTRRNAFLSLLNGFDGGGLAYAVDKYLKYRGD